MKTDEEKLLRVLAPLSRPGTLLRQVGCSVAATRRLQGGSGGSHIGGVPYLEHGEAWPVCAHHVRMRPLFQIDGRDALHVPAFAGLHVVYGCAVPIAERLTELTGAQGCLPEVRTYASPSGERRQTIAYDEERDASVLLPVRAHSFLPDESLIDMVLSEAQREAIAALQLRAPWQRVYNRVVSAEGTQKLLFEDHLGGWHQSYFDRQYMPPPCPRCGTVPRLIAQLEFSDWWRSLWCCEAHPEQAHAAVHK